MCMLVQPGFCCFFPSWWTSKLRHSRLAWCWLTNNVLLVNLVGCCVNQHPKWLIKKHCQSFEFSKWWVFNFIVSLKLMSGAFRGRISPCCFLTGHPFAGTVKERTNRKWVRKRAGKREKTLSIHDLWTTGQKHPVKCWSLGRQLFLVVEGWINALLSMVMTSKHTEINTLFLWRCNMDAWKEILFLLSKSEDRETALNRLTSTVPYWCLGQSRIFHEQNTIY